METERTRSIVRYSAHIVIVVKESSKRIHVAAVLHYKSYFEDLHISLYASWPLASEVSKSKSSEYGETY